MNYVSEVAKMLEIDMENPFYVICGNGDKVECILTDDGMERHLFGAAWKSAPAILVGLITGNYSIEKAWKPELGDIYYYPSLVSDDLAATGAWLNDLWCNNLYNRGLVFQTKEEAQETCKAMLEAIKK